MTHPLVALRRHAWTRPNAAAMVELDRNGAEIERLTNAQLLSRVAGVAEAVARAVPPGRTVALPLANGVAFGCAFLGCLEAGRQPVALPPYETRRGAARQTAILTAADPAAVLVDGAVPAAFAGLPAIDLRAIEPGRASAAMAGQPDDIAFLQFTSGTTGTPRGVAISHAALAINMDDLGASFRLRAGEATVNWLPPFHDMGLFNGTLTPISLGMTSVLVPGLHAIQRPSLWLRAISDYRATMSFAPNFMYAACIDRAASDDLTGLDLSAWRLAGCGAERVDPAVMRLFAAAYAEHGFSADALFPAYGMAEATLFVSGGRLSERRLDRAALAAGIAIDAADGVRLASAGRPGLRVGVRIFDGRAAAADGIVGAIHVSGPALAAGEWVDGGLVPLARETTGADGVRWLDTGDLGMMVEGELFPITRNDDLLIHRGRNLAPDLIEASCLDAVTDRGVTGIAAFPGAIGGGFVVALEMRRGADPTGLALRVRHHLAAAEGAAPGTVLVLRVGTLPRTTSGKIARHRCRTQHATGAWPEAAILDTYADAG